jgi:hypothetical protein
VHLSPSAFRIFFDFVASGFTKNLNTLYLHRISKGIKYKSTAISMSAPTDPLTADCLVTGNVVVDVFEVEELKPIRGWVPIDSSYGSSQPAAATTSTTFSHGPPLQRSYVPWSAFDANATIGAHIARSLEEVTAQVELQLGFKRPGCTTTWEPWVAALKNTPALTTRDRKGSLGARSSATSTPERTRPESLGRHADPAVLAESAWEYAFNSKHEFEPLPEGTAPPTISALAEGIVAAQLRVFIRRRRFRRVAAVAWDSPHLVPEGVRSLSVWCASVKIHKALDHDDSRTNSPRIQVPKLSLGHGRSLSTGPGSTSDVPLSGRLTTRSRAASSIGSTARPGLIPVEHWMKDNDAQKCLNCSKNFGVITRRHHCRLCGRVFCAQCCEKSVRYGGVRVCTPCLREDELCERILHEEQFEEEERLRELERDLLADGPAEDDPDREGEHDTGALVRVPTISSPSGTRLLSSIMFQLESDCRAAIVSEEQEEFVFVCSLGGEELKVLQEICELHTLPSLVQLSDSLRVINFEKSVRLANSGSEKPDGLAQSTRRIGAKSPKAINVPSSTIAPSAASTTAPKDRANNSLTGMLHLILHKVTGTRTADGTMVRCDIRIGNSVKSTPFKGDWCKFNEEPLTGYIMMHNELELINMSVNTRGGNALTDLVLEVTFTAAQVEFTVADLLTKEQLEAAHAAKVPTQFKGTYLCKEVLNSGYKRPIEGAKAVIQWAFDVRPIMGNMDFCEDCGRVVSKCTCYDMHDEDHDDPICIVEPVFLGADVESTPVHSPKICGEKPARSEIVTTERNQVSDAWEKLISCAAERMVLEKRYTIANIEQEQREDYGKLRNTYFRTTNSLFYRIARKKRFPEIAQGLQAIADEAAKRVGCVYVAKWHQHGVIFGPEIRLKRARHRLEERIGLFNSTPAGGATGQEALPSSHAQPTNRPQPKTPVSAKAHPTRQPTSEKCCATM